MEHPERLEFESFELDFAERELLKDGKSVKIEPQVFDLLWYFANHAGQLISKDDIILHVWGGRIVSDAAISTRINGARVAINDSGNEQRVIRTIPRRGFRFLAEVSESRQNIGENEPAVDPKDSTPTNLGEEKPTIAVMPIQILSGQSEMVELAEGMRIDIQNALIKVSGLFLTAVGSVNAAREMEPLEAAKAINARYLLTGQLRGSQNKLRLSVQLLDAATDRIILSEQFDHTVEDTFVVLDEVAAEVLESLNIALVAGEPARVWHKTLRDIESLSIFYRGISNFFKMNRESIAIARGDFERIVRLHPDLAFGYTWIALTHWFDLQRGWAQDKTASRSMARELAEKAVAFPDTDGQAHTVLSHVYLLEREFDKALEAGKLAVANRPSCTNANAFYANVLHYCGLDSEATNHIRLALHQSPFSPTYFKLILVKVLIASAKFVEAEQILLGLLQTVPDDGQVKLLSCLLAARRAKREQAAQHARDLLSVEPDFEVQKYLSVEPYQDENFKSELAEELIKCGLPS
ncbi:Transcriptional activator CadC [Roseibium album]|nr:Transcriptional activator CadC [Roseibium album]